ncbi:unnamed protein product [Lampetra planeri]
MTQKNDRSCHSSSSTCGRRGGVSPNVLSAVAALNPSSCRCHDCLSAGLELQGYYDGMGAFIQGCKLLF